MRSIPILALLAASAAAAHPISVPTTKFTLKNGLTVILREDHSVPRVYTSVRFKVGSSRETPGRTGFAHLFEHLMFEGSEHVPADQKFISLIESIGGENNAFTAEDQTFYFEEVPSNAIEVPFFLDSDRMGFYGSMIKGDLVDHQRDVVKNERRQRVENQPWGESQEMIPSLVFPKGHPYSWSVIGSMKDLSAASIDDVKAFYDKWYAPENAVMTVVGDFDPKKMRPLVEKYFGDVPGRGTPEKATPVNSSMRGEKRVVYEDATAPLPRLTIVWPSVELFNPDDGNLDLVSEALSNGAGSRLQKRLVHDMQIAQNVNCFQHSMERTGTYTIDIIGNPGVPLPKILAAVDDELAKMKQSGPTDAELNAGRNHIISQIYEDLDSLAGTASRLSSYEVAWGNPDGFERDLARYRSATSTSVADTAKRLLGKGRLVLSAVPKGQSSLAVVNPVKAGGAE
jgi:zinc protease